MSSSEADDSDDGSSLEETTGVSRQSEEEDESESEEEESEEEDEESEEESEESEEEGTDSSAKESGRASVNVSEEEDESDEVSQGSQEAKTATETQITNSKKSRKNSTDDGDSEEESEEESEETSSDAADADTKASEEVGLDHENTAAENKQKYVADDSSEVNTGSSSSTNPLGKESATQNDDDDKASEEDEVTAEGAQSDVGIKGPSAEASRTEQFTSSNFVEEPPQTTLKETTVKSDEPETLPTTRSVAVDSHGNNSKVDETLLQIQSGKRQHSDANEETNPEDQQSIPNKHNADRKESQFCSEKKQNQPYQLGEPEVVHWKTGEGSADLTNHNNQSAKESPGEEDVQPEQQITVIQSPAKSEDQTPKGKKQTEYDVNEEEEQEAEEEDEEEEEENSSEGEEEESEEEEESSDEESEEESEEDESLEEEEEDEEEARKSKKGKEKGKREVVAQHELSVTPDDVLVKSAGVLVRNPETSVKFKASKFVSHRLGKMTEHYEVTDFLGQGGFGSVYAATHKITGTIRAVKEMKKSKQNEETNKLILNEFQILKNLDHPNILKMFELFEDSRMFYIITEVCRGGELKEELAQCGTYTEEQTKKLMKQVLGCVNYFHKQKIVHRDLKPGNILLEENKKLDQIKVIDFGMACQFHDDVKLTETMGTVAFMAPEVIGMSYSKECDLWSAGVIAFVVLSGEQPFKAATTEETFNNIINGEINEEHGFASPTWSGISEEAKDFVQKLLTWDESLRPTAEQALQHPWLDTDGSSRSLEGVDTAFSNLGSFQAESRLKIAVCTFIASQLLGKDEKEKLASVFRAIDINNDGSLDKEEVKLGYSKFFSRELSDAEVDAIFDQVDADGTGELEYSEFVFGALGEKKLLSVENLKKAFQIFDKDQSGSISMDELREMLSCDENLDEQAITKIIAQVDADGDGEISFEEWLSIAMPEVREMAKNAKKDRSVSLKFKANSFVAHRLGKLTDHYEVVDYIAKGSFGIVCSATHKGTGALRAIKELKKSKKNEARNEQLLKEFHILKGLDHPNILKMFELFEDKRHYYIVTEVCLGGDLHHELKKRGRFSEEDTALILREVLSCMNYFHKNKIVHRDLKPGNILLEENKKLECLKVIDFGEAIFCSENVKLTEIAGTMSYMAPEVLGMAYAHKVDVWSLGVIAFLLLSGQQPLKGADDKETFANIVNNNWSFSDPVWSDVSSEGKEFVKDLLTWDQNERPSAAQALEHPWLLAKIPKKTLEELQSTTVDALANLEGFDASSKLRLAVCTFIAGQLLNKNEKEKIDEVFHAIDLDNSGTLSKEEVKIGYCQYFGRALSDQEVDAIFKNVSTSGSAELDYSAFVMGALDKQALLSRQNLETAFQIFDVDGSGDITMEELKLMLQDALTNDPEMDDRAIAKIIQDVDADGDGVISLDEFLAMAACPQPKDDANQQATPAVREWQASEALLGDYSVRYAEPALSTITEDSISMSERSDQARTTPDPSDQEGSSKKDSVGSPEQAVGMQRQQTNNECVDELKSRILRAAEVQRAQGADPPGFREVGSPHRHRQDPPSISGSFQSDQTESEQSFQSADRDAVLPSLIVETAQRQSKRPEDPRLTEAYEGFHRVQDKMRKLRLLLRAKNILDAKRIQSNIKAAGVEEDDLTVETLDDAFSKLVQLQSKMRSLQALVKANKI